MALVMQDREQVMIVLLKSLVENGLFVWTGFIWKASAWSTNAMLIHFIRGKSERGIMGKCMYTALSLNAADNPLKTRLVDAQNKKAKKQTKQCSLPQHNTADVQKHAYRQQVHLCLQRLFDNYICITL